MRVFFFFWLFLAFFGFFFSNSTLAVVKTLNKPGRVLFYFESECDLISIGVIHLGVNYLFKGSPRVLGIYLLKL